MELSIIIPTYNEAENIENLLHAINSIVNTYEIIVVDDNSPDGTGKIAESLKVNYPNLIIIHRIDEKGLASAVVEGFKRAHGEIIGVMDADFSHPVEALPRMVEPILKGQTDLVIGSRYTAGGEILGWGLVRKLTSKGAILLARPLTPIKDCVSGLFFFKKTVIKDVDFNPQGYKIGLEVLVKGRFKSAVEIPYTFVNRKKGKSKLSLREYWDYLVHLSNLYRYKIKGGFP